MRKIMKVNGYGTVAQMDKTKTKYNCRKWLLQVSTPNGRKTKRFTGAYRDAKHELEEFINKIENNKIVKIARFEKYVDYYLDYREKSKRYSPNTISTDKRACEHLIRMFKGLKLIEITPKKVRDSFCFVPKINDSTQDLSGTMKRKIFFVLSSIMNMAIDDELIEINPCTKVVPPKRDTKEKKALSQNNFNKLLNALDSEPLSARVVFIYFLLLLGLRRGEAAALKWSDWDKENKTISIKRAYIVADRSIGLPKSKAGIRTLPLPNKLTEILEKWEKKCDEELMDCEWICVNSYGSILIGGACYKLWKRFKNKHKLPDISYHELRHTNLTIVARYMSPFDLKNYAGWHDLEPAQIYIHNNQESMQLAMSRIEVLNNK